MQPFYITVPAFHLSIFVRNVFYNINLPEIQGKHFRDFREYKKPN